MAKHELIRLREHPGAVYPFTLVYYQGQTETGRAKRHRLFFKTLKDAEAEQRAKKTELLNAGIVHDEITDEERRAVVFAREELAKLPAPAGGGAHSITAAINLYCEQARLNLKSATVSEYLPKFLERQRKLGKADRTVSDLKHRLKRFERDFGSRNLRTFTRSELQTWVLALPIGPQSMMNFRRVVGWFFSAAEVDGYADANPARHVETPDVKQACGFLTPKEMKAILAAAPERLRASIVLGGFTGLREAEVGRLTWDAINLDEGHIVISPAITKTKRRRLVAIPANAAAWLAGLKKDKGAIVPPNARRLNDAARRVAGFGKPGSETRVEKSAKVKLRPWPSNALRHSAATYRLAATGSAEGTAQWLGNSAAVLETSYKGLVTPAQAGEWWNIYPPSAAPADTGNVIDFQPDAA
jgi:integrase